EAVGGGARVVVRLRRRRHREQRDREDRDERAQGGAQGPRALGEHGCDSLWWVGAGHEGTVAVSPQRPVNVGPGSRTRSPSPELNASGAHVIGSIAIPARARPGSATSS